MSGLLLGMVLSVCTCWFHIMVTLPPWLVSTDFGTCSYLIIIIVIIFAEWVMAVVTLHLIRLTSLSCSIWIWHHPVGSMTYSYAVLQNALPAGHRVSDSFRPSPRPQSVASREISQRPKFLKGYFVLQGSSALVPTRFN